MLDMLNDILTIGQVESGTLMFNPAPLDVAAVCKTVSSETSQVAGSVKRIALNCQGNCGTGRGPVIVRQSVELYGGTITFESEEGRGTTFTVILPQGPTRE